jgi:hypothetical protein
MKNVSPTQQQEEGHQGQGHGKGALIVPPTQGAGQTRPRHGQEGHQHEHGEPVEIFPPQLYLPQESLWPWGHVAQPAQGQDGSSPGHEGDRPRRHAEPYLQPPPSSPQGDGGRPPQRQPEGGEPKDEEMHRPGHHGVDRRVASHQPLPCLIGGDARGGRLQRHIEGGIQQQRPQSQGRCRPEGVPEAPLSPALDGPQGHRPHHQDAEGWGGPKGR